MTRTMVKPSPKIRIARPSHGKALATTAKRQTNRSVYALPATAWTGWHERQTF